MLSRLIVKNAEPFLKLGTLVLGSLYVLGLLVSNVQLMALGISDFTALQVRNVMTGVLFLLYAALLVVLVSPAAAAIYFLAKVLTSMHRPFFKIVAALFVVAAAAFVSLLVAQTEGIAFGYLLPWGRTWDAGMSGEWWTLQFYWGDAQTGLRQFNDVFGYAKTTWSGLIVFAAEGYVVLLTLGAQKGAASKSFLDALAGLVWTPGQIFSMTLYGVLTLFLLLAGFANDVYPNLKYNLGGGQPSVAQLQIGADAASGTNIDGIVSCCGPDQAGTGATTEPVVIWYQSDKFLYVSPLKAPAQPSASRLVAFDLGLVRTIRYLPRYVRVSAGGQILELH